jgi:putative hydrolase of the HAD superfamily
MARYAVASERFVMIGNSLRSDVLPVLEAGGHAVHVPYEITWVHEQVSPESLVAAHYHQASHIRDVPGVLQRLASAAVAD